MDPLFVPHRGGWSAGEHTPERTPRGEKDKGTKIDLWVSAVDRGDNCCSGN